MPTVSACQRLDVKQVDVVLLDVKYLDIKRSFPYDTGQAIRDRRERQGSR